VGSKVSSSPTHRNTRNHAKAIPGPKSDPERKSREKANPLQILYSSHRFSQIKEKEGNQ
jgi:hypothetical protein